MGVRLVRYSYNNQQNGGNGVNRTDHDELINRDLLNQHPIYAITGLQEVLNILEDSVRDTNELLLQKEKDIHEQINTVNTNIIDINNSINDIIDIINNLNTIDSVEDTSSIHIDYDSNILKANVVLFNDTTNAIQQLEEGIYVPKTETEDTDTIIWNVISNGETLKDIYDNGIRFSHNSNSWSNLYSAAEANAWTWDDSLQSFVQPKNTNYFNGFVTDNFYDYYEHKATIKSKDADNDVNGLIIGFVFDENNNPHTLSVLVQRGSDFGANIRYALVYDYYLPDQQIIQYKLPGNQSTSGWNGISKGITINVTKNRNKVSCMCSNWNSTDLNPDTLMEIDLNDYEWGYMFKRNVRYGYCNISQPNSYFSGIEFLSNNTTKKDTFTAELNISKEDGNAVQVLSDGVYVEKFKISNEDNNALEKKSDGYFVRKPLISSREDNAITEEQDGYYVRSQSNFKTVIQDNHNFTVGDFIYYNPSGMYEKALAKDSYCSNIVGMVTNVIDINTFEYQWSGFFATDIFDENHTFVQGMPLYISDTIDGTVTQTQPDISKAVGYPVENIGLIISIERGIQYRQEASIGDFKTSVNDYNVRSDGFIRVVEEVKYKINLVSKLVDMLSDAFKNTYLIVTENSVQFINTDKLYEQQKVSDGFNLFIKAF